MRSPDIELLHQADERPHSLDDIRRTLVEVADRLNIPIKVRMHEPEKVWPARVLLTECHWQGSTIRVTNNVTLDEKGLVCHVQGGGDRYDKPFAQVSKLIGWILQGRT